MAQAGFLLLGMDALAPHNFQYTRSRKCKTDFLVGHSNEKVLTVV